MPIEDMSLSNQIALREEGIQHLLESCNADNESFSISSIDIMRLELKALKEAQAASNIAYALGLVAAMDYVINHYPGIARFRSVDL
jgi:hypothetical protein